MDNPYWDSSDLDSSGSSYSSEDEDEDYDAYILQLAIQQSLEVRRLPQGFPRQFHIHGDISRGPDEKSLLY
jgi:hypothetical protein